MMSSQQDLIDRAHDVLPGGTFGNFDASIIIKHGKGAYVWDEDGNRYIDLLIGSGPMLLGHGDEEVVEAVQQQVADGMTFFANNARGIELAEDIRDAMTCAEQVRYVSTGGEADMYAMRLARAFTGRDKIMKFEGGYHGMSAEAQMSLAPEQLVNFPMAVPDSAGIPDVLRDEMLVAPYNDIEFARSLIAEHGDEIAGIIVEPLQRIIPPVPGFLETLREEADKHGIVLIFDEVVTGFRLDYGGAQAAYGVSPDLCTLGKVIGGGFPLAAVAGKADIMAHFDKSKVGADGFVMQIGTLSGNPVAAVAGIKTMEILRRPGQYEKLRSIGKTLMDGVNDALTQAGHAHRIVGDPTLFDIVFTDQEVRNYRDYMTGDKSKNAAFTEGLRKRGVFKSAGKLYPCLALSEEDIQHTISAAKEAAQEI